MDSYKPQRNLYDSFSTSENRRRLARATFETRLDLLQSEGWLEEGLIQDSENEVFRFFDGVRAGMLVQMDAEEAAGFLNYPKGTFNALAASGTSHATRGAGWRYKREELNE